MSSYKFRSSLRYPAKVARFAESNQVGVYPLDEGSGLIAYDISSQLNHASYASEIGLGSGELGPAGKEAPTFNGSTDYVNLYTAPFVSDFSVTEGTVNLWYRPANDEVYTDGVVRRLLTVGANATTNVILLEKTAANNTLRGAYIAGSSTKSVSPTVYDPELGYNETGWHMFTLVWSVAGGYVRVYLDGAKSGSDQTSLGTWSGSLNSTLCVIGAANTTPDNAWNGSIQVVGIWNTPLTDNQVRELFRVERGFRP
jgi:hypothetical protein